MLLRGSNKRNFVLSTLMTFILVALACAGSARQQATAPAGKVEKRPTPVDTQPVPIWQPATYQNLTIGTSSREDVVQVFGKPVWEGPAEKEPIDTDQTDEILLEYKNAGGFKGDTTIVIDACRERVKAISLYPKPRIPLQSLVTQYGTEYIERESKLGPCPTEDEIRDFKPSEKREYPITFVYPQHGLYLSIERDQTVSQIAYLAECVGY